MTLDIEVAGLRLRYGEVTALDDLSLTLGGGRIYGLLGRNGAGMTSLLSVLAGFRRPSGGTVRIDGQPVFENPRITRQVCLIRETGDTGDRDDRVRYALWTAARLRPGWDADHADALAPASSRWSSSATGPCWWSGRPSGCSWPPGSSAPAGAHGWRSCWPWPWWW